MPIYETFSKRQRRLAGAGKPVIYRYEPIPNEFRRQVIHIWRDAIGPYSNRFNNYGPSSSMKAWNYIHGQLSRELGVFILGQADLNELEQCQEFIQSANTERVLDIIELSFHVIDTVVRGYGPFEIDDSHITVDPDSAIGELNHRFREHTLGFQFVDGELIRMDSEYMHVEAVEPTLTLLHAAGFRGPEEEFLTAHLHFRNRRYKEAIGEANKAFESTMKVICDQRGWAYDKDKTTASGLVAIMLDEGLIPKYLQDHFNGLRNLLAAGLPTVRNRTGGHGQGAAPVEVPEHLAAYAIHVAASNILLLMEAHMAAKS